MYLTIINKIFRLDNEIFSDNITSKKIEFKQEISGTPSVLVNSVVANKTGKKEPVRGLK